jgi:hypothetical protein
MRGFRAYNGVHKPCTLVVELAGVVEEVWDVGRPTMRILVWHLISHFDVFGDRMDACIPPQTRSISSVATEQRPVAPTWNVYCADQAGHLSC